MTQTLLLTRPVPQAGREILEGAGVTLRLAVEDPESLPSRESLERGIQGADAVLSLLTESIDEELLRAAPGLRGVANMAVGLDNVDVAAATVLGIPVSNTPGILTETTADLAFALLLVVARRIPRADRYTRAGHFRAWGPELFVGLDLGPGADGRAKTLGIVGFGRIGQAVARRAVGFGMRVLAHDPGHRERVEKDPVARWAELDELLAGSDFVSLHVPLYAGTRHLIGPAELGRMQRTAILVNTSRGSVVDERALVEALRAGRIAGAGLDVYEDEPALAPGLAELENAVLLPHVGSASRSTRDGMARAAAENALAHLRGGRAPSCVNPEVYEGEAYRLRVTRR